MQNYIQDRAKTYTQNDSHTRHATAHTPQQCTKSVFKKFLDGHKNMWDKLRNQLFLKEEVEEGRHGE